VPKSDNFVEYAEIIGDGLINTYTNDIDEKLLRQRLAGIRLPPKVLFDNLSWSILQLKLSQYYSEILRSDTSDTR
jgi:hypothetical protein